MTPADGSRIIIFLPEVARGPNQSLVSEVNTCLGGAHGFTRSSLLSITTYTGGFSRKLLGD